MLVVLVEDRRLSPKACFAGSADGPSQPHLEACLISHGPYHVSLDAGSLYSSIVCFERGASDSAEFTKLTYTVVTLVDTMRPDVTVPLDASDA